MKYFVLLLIGLYVPSIISVETSKVEIESIIQSVQRAIDAKVDRKVPDDAYLTVVSKYFILCLVLKKLYRAQTAFLMKHLIK